MKTLDRSLAMMPINQLCTVGFLWVWLYDVRVRAFFRGFLRLWRRR